MLAKKEKSELVEKGCGACGTAELQFQPLACLALSLRMSRECMQSFYLLHRLIVKMAFLVGRVVGVKFNWKIEKR